MTDAAQFPPATAPSTHEPDIRRRSVPPGASVRMRPENAIGLLFAAGAALLWFSFALIFAASAPADNVEQLNWSHSGEWGYIKHPPLSTWLVTAVAPLLGRHFATTYALGIGCLVVAMLLMRRIASEFVDLRTATVCVVLASCAYSFSGRSYWYNHNVAMFPLVGMGYLCFLRIVRDNRWSDWVALGVICGLGMLAKYQYALFIVGYCVGFIQAGAHQRVGFARRLGLAALIGVAVFSPHVWWLIRHDFAPVRYAQGNLLANLPPGRRVWMVLSYFIQQVLRMLPAAAALGLTVWLSRRRAAGAGARILDSAVPQWDAYLWAAVTPFALILIIGVVAGSALQNHWGVATYLPLIPVLCVVAARRRWRLDLATGAVVAAVMHVACAGWLVYQSASSNAQDDALAFPAARFAQRIDALWKANYNAPIQTLVGLNDLGGAIAAELPDSPAVLINADLTWSPWITPQRVATCGTVLVWPPDVNATCPPYSAYFNLVSKRGLVEVVVDPHRTARMCFGLIAPVEPSSCSK